MIIFFEWSAYNIWIKVLRFIDLLSPSHTITFLVPSFNNIQNKSLIHVDYALKQHVSMAR